MPQPGLAIVVYGAALGVATTVLTSGSYILLRLAGPSLASQMFRYTGIATAVVLATHKLGITCRPKIDTSPKEELRRRRQAANDAEFASLSMSWTDALCLSLPVVCLFEMQSPSPPAYLRSEWVRWIPFGVTLPFFLSGTAVALSLVLG